VLRIISTVATKEMTMILRSWTTGLVSVAAMIISFGLSTARAIAETTYNFSADYNTTVEINPFGEPDSGFVRATITGESIEPAPFGLDFFRSETYGQVQPSDNPSILRYNFNSDPSVFGLTDELVLSDRYFGGDNELFGRANDSAEINFETQTISGGGTITMFDGTGIFEGATGTMIFTQQDELAPPGTPSRGTATLNFSIQTPQPVPEPETSAALVGVSAVSAAVILRTHRRRTLDC
jgi:hypothetical protein